MEEFLIIENTAITDDERFHPILRTKWWIFKVNQRIARHVHGFGLYSEYRRGNTYEECVSIINDYKNQIKPVYRETKHKELPLIYNGEEIKPAADGK